MSRLRTYLVCALTAVAVAFSGCTANTTDDNSTSGESTTSESRVITDHAGNEVTLPAEVTRVAVDQIPIASTYLAYFNGEAPYLVGMAHGVVSALEGTVAAKMAPEMMEVDTSYYDNGELNTETLLTLEPDVVFYNARNTENYEKFKAAGIPAVGFKTTGDPTTVYVEWLQLLEQVFDEPGKTDEIVEYGQEIVTASQARNAAVADRKDVLILFSYAAGTLRVAGEPEFFGSYWLETANANNVAVGTTEPLATVTGEQVLAWEPDTVLVVSKGQSQITPQQVMGNELDGLDLTSMTAVADKQVYTTGLGMWSWFTPNPDAPLIADWIGQAVYPELIDRDALVEQTREYYDRVYNYSLSDEEIDSIYADAFEA